jgi:hypothetical protein
MSTAPRPSTPAEQAEHFAPDLVPTGDPEQDLTQLVTLLEHFLETQEERPVSRVAVAQAWREVTTFAKHLRGGWDDGLETGDGRQ